MPLGNPIRKQNESRMVSVLATEGQTVFTVQGGYIINHISVFRNGVRLSPAEDFTAGDGSTVTLNNAANIDDRVDFHIFDRFTVQNAIVGAASTQTINGDLVLNGKLFGQLDVPSINLTGIITATELDLNGKADISSDLNVTGITTSSRLNVTGFSTFTGVIRAKSAAASLPSSGTSLEIYYASNILTDAPSGYLISYDRDASAYKKLTYDALEHKFRTSDTLKLHINPSGVDIAGITTTTGIVCNGDVNITDKIQHVEDSDTAIRFPGNDTFTVETAGSERLRVDSNGKVLIGHNSSLAIGGGDNAPLQVTSTTSVLFGGARYVNSSSGPFISLSKSRAASAGSNTIVQDGDDLGTLLFSGDDGTDLISKGAQIQGQVDGTPGVNDMPGRLLFYTTSDGSHAPTERMRITSTGKVGVNITSPRSLFDLGTGTDATSISNTAADYQLGLHAAQSATGDIGRNIAFISETQGTVCAAINSIDDGTSDKTAMQFVTGTSTSISERIRITGSGLVLIGTTADVAGGATSSKLQIRGTSYDTSLALVANRTNSGGGNVSFSKSRGSSQGDATIVQNGDTLGSLVWYGADGTDINSAAAQLDVQVDTVPGGNDMPGRFVFRTTADGASSPTERMRITSAGLVGVNQTSPSFTMDLKRAGTDIIRMNNSGETTHGNADAKLVAGGTYYQNMDFHAYLYKFQTYNGSSLGERLRITKDGQVLIGTDVSSSFNGVGQSHNLIVAGDSSNTDIVQNHNAAITISNTDGTANNTAGLHFAREDTDGNPHYTGAAVVAQFKETMNTGQYPKADLAFLTSTANNNAPSQKMRLYANGEVLSASHFVSKTTAEYNANVDTSSGFTGSSAYNIVLAEDVLDNHSVYIVNFSWNHNGSGQPYLIDGAFVFQPGATNPGSAGAMGPTFTPVQGAHTEQGVSKYFTFRYYSPTGGHVHGLQAASTANLNDANGNGHLQMKIFKIGAETTI